MKNVNFLKIINYHFKNDNKSQFFWRVLRFILCEYVNLCHRLKLSLIKIKNNNNYIIKKILGSKMILDLNDKGISLDLLMNGVREELATEITKKIIKRGDIILDIGGNIGYYALLESRLTGPVGKVFVIEPVNKNVEKLKKNIKLNNYTNMEVFQLAVGDRNEKNSIFLSDRSNWCSMKYRENININQKIIKEEVKVVTLDEFFKDKPLPDLIRMDVEGYEYEIIKGMENLLKTNRPFKIFFEIHIDDLQEKTEEILDILYQHGFKFKIGAWKELRTKSKLLKKIYNFLSEKVQTNSTGCFYSNNINELKEIFDRRGVFPQVLFERE